MIQFRYLNEKITLRQFPEKCIGCGMCLEVCPHSVWQMKGRKAAIVDRGGCMECGACAKNCPVGAVEVEAGVGCARAIINGVLSGGKPCCDGVC
jgi:ferredoxin